MAYSLEYLFYIGPQNEGLTLCAQIYDSSDTPVGSEITTGITDNDNGFYSALISIPDGHRGRIEFYEDGSPTEPLAGFAINPEEGEYLDQALSTTESNIRGADSDTLKTLSDQLDGAGTLANQTTILARIGAFTGTGINTILGFLKALASKAASTPSDIGGTFLASSDSQEAISDRLSSAQITARTIVAQGGDVETYQGADYLDADGYALEWTDSDNSWPTLTGATISVFLNGEEYAGSVVTATGANKKVRYEPTSAITVALPVGIHPFVISATLINTHVVILVAAGWESKVMEVEET